jgi:hypothetical protein
MVSKNTRTRLITVNGKKCRASRVIMSRQLGRELLCTEQVHHINKNPLDNRIENLELLDAKTHMNLHKGKYPEVKTCEICGHQFTAKPHKRKSQRTCGKECAHILRVLNMMKTRYG